MLRSEHTRANGLVNSLDLGEIHPAARVADQHRARHFELRERLPAARGDGARARRDDLAAFEQRLHVRMVLELLKRLERLEARVLIVEPGDEAYVHPIVVEVIHEAAAVGMRVEWPAERVLDQPRLRAPRRQLPQL